MAANQTPTPTPTKAVAKTEDAKTEAKTAAAEAPVIAVTSADVLEAVKNQRAAAQKLLEEQAQQRKEWNAKQRELRTLLTRAKDAKDISVLAENALNAGIADTADASAFLSQSEALVRELAAREHLS